MVENDRLTLRAGSVTDLDGIALLVEGPGTTAGRGAVAGWIEAYPSSVALDADDACVGVAYTKRFAPDILELANIRIDPAHRSRGLGSQLLAHVEAQASASGWRGVILVNSLLYPSRGPKRLATGFYLRAGYAKVFSTADSNVFAKAL